MKKIIFVCHGSICRSPAAENIFNAVVKSKNLEDKYCSFSYALSYEEIGNDIYPPMKRVLIENDIPLKPHSASKLTQKQLDDCDYLFYMDGENKDILDYEYNVDNSKCFLITKFSNMPYIEDPWYSTRYEFVYKQIKKCILDIIEFLENQ